MNLNGFEPFGTLETNTYLWACMYVYMCVGRCTYIRKVGGGWKTPKKNLKSTFKISNMHLSDVTHLYLKRPFDFLGFFHIYSTLKHIYKIFFFVTLKKGSTEFVLV